MSILKSNYFFTRLIKRPHCPLFEDFLQYRVCRGHNLESICEDHEGGGRCDSQLGGKSEERGVTRIQAWCRQGPGVTVMRADA